MTLNLGSSSSQTPIASRNRPEFWTQFGRSQLSAFAASITDFAVMFSLAELGGIHYVFTVAAGAFSGAVLNFLVNRHWSFEAEEGKRSRQILRYALVSTGSLLLNTGCTWAATEGLGWKYGWSRVWVSLLIGFFFNFPLHRNYVFR